MLFIDPNSPHIIKAKDNHVKLITCFLNRKIQGKTVDSICTDKSCVICCSKMQKAKKTTRHLENVLIQLDISKIAGGLPSQIKSQYDKFRRLYLTGKRSAISKKDSNSLRKIFNYEWFDDKANDIYNAYDLCNTLKIESCVYCNRIYTSTVTTKKGKSIIRPTLDHWFSQSRYPILALSFYNLIPSCSPCNSSVKHNMEFTLGKNFHPYTQKDITLNYSFMYSYNKSLDEFKISIDSKDKKILDTLGSMRIAEIYDHHQSEISDLDILKRKYNKQYLADLGKLLGKTLTDKDVYRILFGVEYDDTDFYKRPLSKLKKDILNLKLK